MKLKSFFIGIIGLYFFVGCSKNEEGKCIKCEQSDSVEICDAGEGKVSLVVEGKVIETQPLQEGQTLDEIAAQTCASLSVDNCYECMGPNVNDFEICQEGDDISINGELLPDLNGLQLDDVVQELINNASDEVVFRNLSCTKN